MGTRNRRDEPGAWHHVTNRGIARRTLFESRADMRYFLSCLARVARAGLIEIHAFAVMQTHFHMLIRSPNGELSTALKLIQNRYSRWFNRLRRRDGSLVRGRFWSKRVVSDRYRRTLIRYIDLNPITAGLTGNVTDYPFGSARAFVTSDRKPLWLARSYMSIATGGRGERRRISPSVYRREFGTQDAECDAYVVESRLRFSDGDDPWCEIDDLSTDGIVNWMRRKAHLADGTTPLVPIISPARLLPLIAAHESRAPEWRLRFADRAVDVWPVVRVGLIRDLCGAKWAEVERFVQLAASRAAVYHQRHRRALREESDYAERVAAIVADVMRPAAIPES